MCCKLYTQNDTRQPKSLIVNAIIWMIFVGFSCWSKYSFIWRKKRAKFLDKFYNMFFKLSKIRYLKYLVVVQEMFWIIFCFVLLIIIWPYLKIAEGWYFGFILRMSVLKITQIRHALNQWWIVANVLNQFFYFVLWRKMDDVMLRLLIVLILSIF